MTQSQQQPQQPSIGISATADGMVQFIHSQGVVWAMDLKGLQAHVAACLDAGELAAYALERKATLAARKTPDGSAPKAAPSAPQAPSPAATVPHNGAATEQTPPLA